MNDVTRHSSSGLSYDAGQNQQYLTFALGGEKFGIEILGIKEIIEYASLTDVPMMPGYVRGVINLRGAVVPVLDLGRRFGRESSPITKRTCIVIIQSGEETACRDLGVIVDSVDSVVDIPPQDIEPAPAMGQSLGSNFIRGMGKLQGKFVILLGLQHMLAVGDGTALSGEPA